MEHPSARQACREYWERCVELPGLRSWQEAEPLLDLYTELLLGASDRRNLLAVSQRNPESIWGHIYDSLQALRFAAGVGTVLDAGSGNGLPGAILALALPDVRFTLVERTQPKSEFLELVVARCALRNAAVQMADLSRTVVRAVAPDLIVMRALVSAESERLPVWLRDAETAWIVFATEANCDNWIAVAEKSGFMLHVKHEYNDSSNESARMLLKFARP